MVSPLDPRNEGFPYALDNGAWSAFVGDRLFDSVAFLRALQLLGAGADFVVVPDIVAGGPASLELSLEWLPLVRGTSRLALLAVQDGMEPGEVLPYLGPRVGLFIGGSTEWKLETLAGWCQLARRAGAYCHVGRVNSARRIGLCIAAGAHSFDGSGASRFRKVLNRLDNARRQRPLFEAAP